MICSATDQVIMRSSGLPRLSIDLEPDGALFEVADAGGRDGVAHDRGVIEDLPTSQVLHLVAPLWRSRLVMSSPTPPTDRHPALVRRGCSPPPAAATSSTS